MKQFVWLFAALLLLSEVKADNFQSVKDGPLHEAYIVQEFGTILIETVPNQPPPPIKELTPTQDDAETIWIPGYWGWSHKYGQFLWVSGVWRRPPPGHQWIPGYWKYYPDGWVWIRGFWSVSDPKNLVYILNPPPDPIDENVSSPPSQGDDYYWVPGNWSFDQQTNQYVWYAGQWNRINPHWVYVPAQYIWREKGYVWVSNFWDWPMDSRGLPFAAILIDPNIVDAFIYEPVDGLQQLVVMQLLFPNWPNYACLFHYHYYFHQDAWNAWGTVPPWWNWPTWWGFTWPDTWWLWWWWSHSGYPNPSWMNSDLANKISPPPPIVVTLMEQVKPPANVTPNGVVGAYKLLNAIQKISGKKLPILPSDPKQVGQIQEVANPQTAKSDNLVPTGKTTVTGPLQKPFFGPSPETLKVAPRTITLPPFPSLSSPQPKKLSDQDSKKPQALLDSIFQLLARYTDYPYSRSYSETEPYDSLQQQQEIFPQYPQTDPHPRYRTPQAPRTQLPTYTPELYPQDKALYPLPAERAIPQPQRPPLYRPTPGTENGIDSYGGYENDNQFHMRMVQPPAPKYHYQTPYQGYNEIEPNRQHTPMEAEHHDYYMSHPQPQINPEGPKINQVPGDYSTLPNQ